jgi:PhnB protein
MTSVQLNPYIYFNGNAKEAMEFYRGVFGGELSIQQYGDVPGAFPEGVSEEKKSWVMHANLDGGGVKLFASDSDKASDAAKKIELSLMGDDEPGLRKVFQKLGEGGVVNSPLEKMFWGDIFGNVTDKFGVTWMVDVTPAH